MIVALTDEQHAELDLRFDHHPPDAAKAATHGLIRDVCKYTARRILQECPAGRERALALTALEESMMWANAAIARHG